MSTPSQTFNKFFNYLGQRCFFFLRRKTDEKLCILISSNEFGKSDLKAKKKKEQTKKF